MTPTPFIRTCFKAHLRIEPEAILPQVPVGDAGEMRYHAPNPWERTS